MSSTVLMAENRAKVAEAVSKPLPKAELLANRSNKASDPASKPNPPPPSPAPKLPTVGSSKESRPLNVEKATGGGSKPVTMERLRLPDRMKRWALSLQGKVWKVGREDPRKAAHSIKVGLALTVVSLTYLWGPLSREMGANAILAVLTVVLVLEFTVGATLYKGVNRAIGSLSALALAVIIEIAAQKLGRLACALWIGASVFLIGASTTYMRFFPLIKTNYDQSALIFLATFTMLTASGHKEQNALHMALQRLYAIAFGFGVCFVMGILILPSWSSEDLQNSIISEIEALAKAIQASVTKYFQDPDIEIMGTDSSTNIESGYEAALECSSSDEFRARFASWEPRHSRYCYPWQEYVQLGKVLRHLRYTAISLHGCLESQIQTPRSVRALFREPCKQVAEEVAKVLNELANTIRDHSCCSPHISDQLHEALQDLDFAIKSQPWMFLSSNSIQISGSDTSNLLGWLEKKPEDQPKETKQKSVHRTLSKIAITTLEFSEALPFAAFVAMLVEIVAQLELVIEEVEELGRIANFKHFHEGCDNIRITIDR